MALPDLNSSEKKDPFISLSRPLSADSFRQKDHLRQQKAAEAVDEKNPADQKQQDEAVSEHLFSENQKQKPGPNQEADRSEPVMSVTSMKALTEGLLFIAGEDGLSLIQLQSVLPECSRTEITAVLGLIREEYEKDDHGFELARFGQRYKFVSKENIYSRAKKLYEDIIIPTLSSAALETLAIIAYRQPVTRVEIEQIRGVSSEAMLKKLQARSLIETDGRLDAVGKPLLYRVTEHFLDIFGIESLDDLPEMKSTQTEGELFGEPDFDSIDSVSADGNGRLRD